MVSIGIDFGSKKAGTTVAAILRDLSEVELKRSSKGEDADKFLDELIPGQSPDTVVAIDAPLSLPLAFYDCGDDFFYRRCDRELSAMSPMFLGGLTARAVRLAVKWRKLGVEVIETYPKLHGQKFAGYKKDPACLATMAETLAGQWALRVPRMTSWHDVDALCALGAALRYRAGEAEFVGDPREGLIWS